MSREETVPTEMSVHESQLHQQELFDKMLKSDKSSCNLKTELLHSVRSRLPGSMQKMTNEDLISDLRKSLDSSELNQLQMLSSKDSKSLKQLR